ncbi:MAG: HlyD family efflux transporter periplasmic adaptor subunit [Paucimonas sp.]|nr:HlyD family efflux transporter periplasmic adaptor subunit [Paucimonas sp.]
MPIPFLLVMLALASAAWPMLHARAQSTDLIRIDDERLRRAGIAFSQVQAAQSSPEQLRLAGIAVLPANALEVVSAPAAGVVQAVLVQPLQAIAAGAVVLRLHSPQVLEWQRDYLQGRSQLALASDKLARDQALFNEGIIARSRIEETRSAHLQAQAALQERRQLLRLAGIGAGALERITSASALTPEINVVARSAGTVIELPVLPGQRVDAGAPLLKLARSGDLLLELQASRDQAARIAAGNTVRVAGCERAGRVTASSSQVNAANQSVTVRVAMPSASACLRPNQHVEADVTVAAAREGASVPASALLRHQGRDYVMLREAGGVRPVAVTAGQRSGDSISVQGALPPKASVAVQGTAVLKGIWTGFGADAPAPK